jgi:hypothetical protein
MEAGESGMTTQWTGLQARACPWCGSTEVEFAEIDTRTYAGCCAGCGAVGPHREGQHILEALDRWNAYGRTPK